MSNSRNKEDGGNMASKLEELCGERIRMLNMQTYYTITDYMVHNEYIMEKDISRVYAKITEMDTGMKKDSIVFELACFELGMISEEDLIDIIIKFRGVEVILPAELEQMQVTYESFNEDLCKKHQFFEYINPNGSPNVKYIVVSFTSAERINSFLKRSISDYRIRYSLPAYIDKVLGS